MYYGCLRIVSEKTLGFFLFNMFLINRGNNQIEKIQQKSFSELGFREREHLQEWIKQNPEALGEELLIIQKEFSGFSDTNERLDLLALDKQGNLVHLFERECSIPPQCPQSKTGTSLLILLESETEPSAYL